MNVTKPLFLSMSIFALGIFGCSEEPTRTSNPTSSTTKNTCQLTSIGEVSDNSAYNTTYTYDNTGNLISIESPDGLTAFTYVNSKLTAITIDDVTCVVSYEGYSLPYRLEFEEDGETYFFILESENNRYTTFKSYYVENVESILEDVTELTYNANGNVIGVTTKFYDAETDELVEFGSIKNISHDNKKNPYLTSPALMIMEYIEGNEANLSQNNVVNYTYNYGTARDISNSYTYNNDDYPTQRLESGFSSPTTFNFSYNCD